MIAVRNRIYVNAEYHAQFEERFANRENLVDKMDGFVSFQLWQPQNPEDPYVVLTMWESQEYFEAWTTSEAFRQGHAKSGRLPKEAYPQAPKLEVSEVILHRVKSTAE